jgi:hypothetical protein
MNVRFQADGNVGIGTSEPAHKLDVTDTVQMTGFKMPTGAADGYVLTSNTSGIGTWQAVAGGSDGDWTVTGNDMYSAVPGSVGVGTASPAAKLDVRGTLNVGEASAGHDVHFYGADSTGRMFWDESKMALRAGITSGSHWDDGNVGSYSFGAGRNSQASGIYSVALGMNSMSTGYATTALGEQTSAGTRASTAMGYLSSANGFPAFAAGYYATASAGNAVAIGRYVTADGVNSMVFGNGVDTSNRLVNSTSNSLVVGFDDTTATLFVGGPNHRVGIGTATPSAKLDVQGTLNVGHNPTGYDVNFYGAESGRRFFWDASKYALRTGSATGTEWDDSNVGSSSFACGNNTKASGAQSVAMGDQSRAMGSASFAFGFACEAQEMYSIAMGCAATGGGVYSVAIGTSVRAVADTSIVIGKGGPGGGWLENNIPNSLMVGFNTATPTLFVGGSNHRVGVQTSTPARPLHVSDVIRLEPRASEPDSAAMGDMYIRSYDGKLMVHDGTTWQACW